jgi:nicotinate-nucleotide--dimethylbenzimidazole phosphoribosyltransferase
MLGSGCPKRPHAQQVVAMTRTPFDDIRALCAQLPDLDAKAARAMQTLIAALPGQGQDLGALGPALSRWAAVRGQAKPVAQRPALTLFSATHGGHDADPKREADILAALAAGGMPVNFACGEAGVGLRAFELALDHPTPDIRESDALSERDCAATIAFGMEALADGPDVVLLSNTPSPGAVWSGLCVFAALEPEGEPHWRAQDPGLDRALTRIGRSREPLDVLRRLGGRDIAAMTGAILAARAQKAFVILDGWGAAAAHRVVQTLDPDAATHCVLAEGERTLALPGSILPPGVPLEPTPRLRCSAASDAFGLAAVASFVQLKTAAAIVAKAPPAKQLGLDA